jgi:hypothetical protein
MAQLASRLAFGLREAAWKVDQHVLWPASDAIQYKPSEDGHPPEEQRSWWRRYGVDLAIAAALAVVAFLLRRHGLPTDGLWLDDAFQSAALPASPSDLFAVSADHPGYTALLIGWRDLGLGSDAQLTWPTLAAGVLGPALLYLALRYCGYERSIGVLMGAALAVAATDVVYSGRVKTFTIDALIVLGLAVIIPRLTRIRWRWWTGLAWVASAAVLAFWSGFGLIAVAVAGLIIVLHPRFDFTLRLVAVAVQGAICVVLLAAERHAHNVTALQDQFRSTWDAFIDFNNPIQFAGDSFVHFRRVGEYFVGASHWLAGLCIVLAIVALCVAAWEGRQAVRARYLLLLLLAVFIAGVAGKFPFGPSQGSLYNSGGRVSLWLIPVVAIGLAAALHGLRDILPGRVSRLAFDAAACVAAVAIVVVGLSRDQLAYPFPGGHSATQFIQSQLGEGDVVLLGSGSSWSYATESGLHSGIRHFSGSYIGFSPTFDDPRVHGLDNFIINPPHVAPEVGQATRVFVYYAEPPYPALEERRTQLTSTLGALGFRQQPTRTFQNAYVEIWTRARPAPRAALASVNLALSDLPPGWRIVGSPYRPPGTRILTCLRVLPAGSTPGVVVATGPPGLAVVSQLDRWRSAGAASRAVSAFGSPGGTRCVGSSFAQAFAGAGLPLRFTVKRVPAPPGAGRPAVAYHVVKGVRLGSTGVAGTVLFLARGRTTALVEVLRAGPGPFPPTLPGKLARTLARRISGASR